MITVSYDGVRLNDTFYVLDIKRPLPEFKPVTTVVNGADGEEFDGLTIGPRECSMTLVVKTRTARGIQDAAREVMRMLAKREPARLRFSDELDPDGTGLYRLAVPYGSFDVSEFMHAAKWEVKFKSPNPYLYGKSRSVVLNKNREQTIKVGGNAESWPKVTSNPTASSYTITVVGGEHVTYKAAFGGRKLTIDMHRQTAKVSGSASGTIGVVQDFAAAVSAALGGDNSGLQTGSRFFSISGTVKLKASAKSEVTWRERWL